MPLLTEPRLVTVPGEGDTDDGEHTLAFNEVVTDKVTRAAGAIFATAIPVNTYSTNEPITLDAINGRREGVGRTARLGE